MADNQSKPRQTRPKDVNRSNFMAESSLPWFGPEHYPALADSSALFAQPATGLITANPD